MYRLTLLGGVLLEGPEGPVVGRAVQQRRLALLALIGSAGDRGRSRDQLIAFLWPETDPSEARQHLSNSIYVFRQALGEEAVRSAAEFVRLSRSRVDVDSRLFEEALERGDSAAAAREYGGLFMHGFFLDGVPEFARWVEEERRRLAKLYVQAVETEAAAAEAGGGIGTAADWWGRLVDHDPYNSAAVVRYMEALCAAGDPANALLAAADHRDRLAEDLGIEPTRDVVDLAERIRRGETESSGSTARVSSPPAAPAPSPPPVASERRRRYPARLVAWVVVAAAVLVVATLWIISRSDGPSAELPALSLAVIPFMNLTGDSAVEHQVDGVTDQLIAVLSRTELRVVAQTSSFHFKDRPLDVRAIADSLGVDNVLEGSVGATDTGYRITAQLIDAESGFHMWTETYDRAELPYAEYEIVAAVLPALGLEFSVSSTPAGAATRDAQAWRDYARARHWWSKRTPAGTDTAITYFRRAVEEDPAWALAWSGLADAHITGMFWDHIAHTDSVRQEVRSLAERAVRLDSTLAEARTSYGAVLGDIENDQEAAAAEFERALELNPNYAVARQWYGETLFMRLGRTTEGLEELRQAYKLDPLSPIIVRVLADFIGWSPNGAQESVRFYRLARDLEPGQWAAHSNLATALACAGRDDEARVVVAGLRETFPDEPRAQLDAASVLGILRDYDSAGVIIDRIRRDFHAEAEYSGLFSQIAIGIYVEQGRMGEAMAEYRRLGDLIRSHSPNTLALTLAWIYAKSGDEEASRTVLGSVPADRRPRQRAGVLAALGDYDEALDLLLRTVREQQVLWDVACIGADPDFDAVNEDPRFVELLDLVGLDVD